MNAYPDAGVPVDLSYLGVLVRYVYVTPVTYQVCTAHGDTPPPNRGCRYGSHFLKNWLLAQDLWPTCLKQNTEFAIS